MARMRAGLVAVAMLSAALPLGVQAQGNAPTAEQLEQRAQALFSQPAMYAVAAGLYQRAASLRSPGQAQKVEDL
ncbi:MAG TPA: hypothetical protein VF832_00655, partial [Longimicrobiales bacterium]